MLIPVFLVAALTLAIAAVSPPNNFDSMTYHMSRVEHWRANGSVSHYPTNSVWQLYLSPFAEFVILHFQTLGRGSDRFANLVQWLFFLASMAATSSIVKIIGGNRRAQLISVLAVATCPMLILQATSTQNDVVCSFFVAAVVLFSFKSDLSPSNGDWAYLCLAAALAVATKGTAYAFLPPFLIWALWKTYRKNGPRAMLVLGTLLGTTMLMVNSGHWLRNYDLWSNALGDPEWLGLYRTQTYGLNDVVWNAVMNVLIHLGTPFVHVNAALEHFAALVSTWLGVSLNDPRINFAPNRALEIAVRTHDTFAGNALHTVLLFLALCLMALKGSPIIRAYSALWLSSALLFCFLIKWAPFNTRLHSSLFVLGAVLIGLSLSWLEDLFRATSRPRTYLAWAILASFALIITGGLSALGGGVVASIVTRNAFFVLNATCVLVSFWIIVRHRAHAELIGVTVICMMSIGSLPWLLCNELRPLIPLKYKVSVLASDRVDDYFAELPELAKPFRVIVQRLKGTPGCHTVGIKGVVASWEYPLWALATVEGTRLQFVHTAVENASANAFRVSQKEPLCSVFSIGQSEESPYDARSMELVLSFARPERMALYTR